MNYKLLMHPTARSFKQRVRSELGIEIDIREFPEGTKTARDAADVIGCAIPKIAKSIVMEVGNEVVIVVTSGSSRVSERKLAKIMGVKPSEVNMAKPELVKEMAGWSVGGVPPFCHKKNLKVLIDEDLMGYDTVWAAAGTRNAVFPISPEKIKEYSNGEIVDIATYK